METIKCGKGWSERCAASKGKQCKCACGGRNHGKQHSEEKDKPWWLGTDGLHVGYLVRIVDEAPMGGEIAYVYEIYQDFDDKTKRGVSLITATGRDTGGWSYAEQQKWLKPMYDTRHPYTFENVTRLAEDYRNGYFNTVFSRDSNARRVLAPNNKLF